jgi:hypothetical protein
LTVSERHLDVLGIPLIVMEGRRPGAAANHLHPGVNAGVTFTTLRDMTRHERCNRCRREGLGEAMYIMYILTPAGHHIANESRPLVCRQGLQISN